MATVAVVATVVAAVDERRHRRGARPWWGESWSFDFAAAGASLGGFVRLGLYPNQGVAWYWAALVGHGRRLVLVRDHEIELPKGASLEVRGQGLWSAVTCETPLDHWSIGLEAFAVALDDPLEAFRGERGDLVGVGFDLEWEALAPAFSRRSNDYGQACRVSGEILVGDEQLAFDGTGHRDHAWGIQDWWLPGGEHAEATGILDDGHSFAVGDKEITATTDDDGLPMSAIIDAADRCLTATVNAVAPILIEGDGGRRAHLTKSLCLYQSADGASGAGWLTRQTEGQETVWRVR